MPRLISRQSQIPNGFQFYEPRTKWSPPRYASFDAIVSGLISHRKGNPDLVAKFGLATDKATVEREVDTFNALICKQHGWTDYYVDDGGGDASPKYYPHNSQQQPNPGSARLVVGAATLADWISSGAESVPQVQANMRALTCAKCPINNKSGFENLFTRAASEAIRQAISLRSEWKLATPLDDQLGVCDACGCPLKLMIHVPLEMKLKHMPEESLSKLHSDCWVLKEKANDGH